MKKDRGSVMKNERRWLNLNMEETKGETGKFIHDNNDCICTIADKDCDSNKIKEHFCEVPNLKK